MRLTRIHYDGSLVAGANITLTESASHHLVRVLRLRRGTYVRLFNGTGGEYHACMLDEGPRHANLRIEKFIDIDTESPIRISLLQGISRADRMDLVVQKAVELGVKDIIPVICQHGNNQSTVGLRKKHQRWQQIAISACEQSARTVLPSIAEPADLQQALIASSSHHKLVLDPASSSGLKQLGDNARSISILIGPEGGFAAEEIRAAHDAGFQSIKFGPRILRTETAGIAAVAACQLLWGDTG